MKDQKSLRIFILSDDAWQGSMLEQHASLNPDYQVKRFESPDTFFQHLQERPDAVVLDCQQNAEVLRRIKLEQSSTQVIAMAGREGSANCAQMLKLGAFECIVKDDHMQDRLWNTLLHLQQIISLRHEVEQLKQQPAHHVHAESNGNGNGNGHVNGLGQLFMKEISLREYECQIIQYYLEKYNKDVLLVAKKLDIGKSTIYRMIQNGELNKGMA